MKYQKMQCKNIHKILNQALQKIAGAFRTTATATLGAEIGILPIEVRLESFHRKYATRILTMPPTHPIRELLPNSFR